MEAITIHPDYQQSILRDGLSHLLGDLDGSVFDAILPRLEWVKVDGGEVIFEEGATGDELFIVVSGRLRASVRGGHGEARILGEITHGETVGEISILTGEPRTATVTAVRSSVLARLTRDSFQLLLAAFPQMSTRLTRLIIERLRRTNRAQAPARRPVSIALLPIADGVDVEFFAIALENSLKETGRILRAAASIVESMFGRSAIEATLDSPSDYLRITQWLDEAETRFDTILLVADRGDTPWTQRCLRHADEVLLVGDAGQSSVLHRLERTLLVGSAAICNAALRLVLLHPPGTRLPRNTGSWLECRNLVGHVHVRRGEARDLARLARIISGNAVGLVLSGGGARGFAHLGVFRALVEAGIEVDYVGGTSMGAVIGSLVALDVSPDEAVARIRHFFRVSPIGDLNVLPLLSLMSAKRLDRDLDGAFQKLCGHAPDIEDTWKEFYCIASSYSYSREVIMRRGPLAKLVRASISIPAFFPPVFFRGEALLDGAIFNNFPTDEMRRMGVGKLVGVDLREDFFGPVTTDAPPHPWQIVASFLGLRRGKMPKVPYIGGMMYRAPMLYSESRQQKSAELADILVRPELSSVGHFEWGAIDQAIDIGYRCARQEAERWRGLDCWS